MIQMNQSLQKVKEEFFSICREEQIPTHNKAALLYELSTRLQENKNDSLLRQMILLVLADNDVLLNHFCSYREGEEEEFQCVKENYKRLETDDKLQQEMSLKWKEVWASCTKSPRINAQCDVNEMAYKERTKQAARLYRKFMEINEKDSPELYNNLHHFICMAEQAQEYQMIMPLFLFQLMTRHTGRLAAKENLNVSFKSLWSYKKYQIAQDNGKNYSRYQLYTKLFVKLCKAYRNHDGVDLPLCQYGFWKTSNLAEWIMDLKPKKAKKALTPFFHDLLRADMSAIACCEPEEYSSNIIYGISDEQEWNYIQNFWDDYEEVKQVVGEFVFEHIEYVIYWMEHLYTEQEILKGYVEEIYRACIPKLPKEKTWMENHIRVQIYDIVREMLELAVRTKVTAVLTQEDGEEGE